MLTPRRWLDWILGFVLVIGSATLTAIGLNGHAPLLEFVLVLFASLVLAVWLKPRYPVFCRGIKWGLLAIPLLIITLLLGAFALCLSGTMRL